MVNGTFITITGFRNYAGVAPFSIGKMFLGQKEPSNAYDTEAIKILDEGNRKIGYIANGTNTKANGTMTAGRLYDRIGEFCLVEVCFSTSSKIICEVVDFNVSDKDLIDKFITPPDYDEDDYDEDDYDEGNY